MQDLELAVWISTVITLSAMILPFRKRAWNLSLLATMAGLSMAHLILEGYRWQMVPIYAFSGVLLMWGLWRCSAGHVEQSQPACWRRMVVALGKGTLALLLIASSLLPTYLPVFELPEPSGPFGIGTSYLYLIDQDRIDEFSSEPGRHRELSIRMWYPIEAGSPAPRVPYMRKEAAVAMARAQDLPRFFLTHFSLVETHSVSDGEPSRYKAPFPVVLYSPSGQISQNTALFEELASHGYVVFAVSHPYWNAFHYDGQGNVIPLDPNNPYYQALWEEERSDAANAAKEKITVSRDLDRAQEAYRELNSSMPSEVKDLRFWGEDLGFLLDELVRLNESDGMWNEVFDLERVGVIGFSKGGAAAGQFCISDSRCKAGVNLSGFMFGDIVDRPLAAPFMFIENYEEWCKDCPPINELFLQKAADCTYMIRVRDASHGNFSDWSLVGRFLRLIGVIGPIDGHRLLKIQNSYVLSFFDKHLVGLPAPILESPTPAFPEVVFDARIPETSRNPSKSG